MIVRAFFFILLCFVVLVEAQKIDANKLDLGNTSLLYDLPPPLPKGLQYSMTNLGKAGQQTSDRWQNARVYPQKMPSGGLGGLGGRLFPEGTETNVAAVGQYPFYVFLTVTTGTGTKITACNGALISEAWVITAAQCVYLASSTLVVAGTVDIAAATPPSSYGEVHIHPGFRSNYLTNDIALIRLLAPFALSANIYPIKLARRDSDMNSQTVRTIGIGVSIDGGALPGKVFSIELVHMSKALCKALTRQSFFTYPSSTACLSTSYGTRGFCYGDAGGPVVYTFPDDVSFSLLGINSIYQGCPSAYPMAYTRIAPYYSWIRSKVKKLLN